MEMDFKKRLEKYVGDIIKASIAECVATTAKDHEVATTNVDALKQTDDGFPPLNGDNAPSHDNVETFAEKLVKSCIDESIKTMTSVTSKRIICVGIVCLDLITVCDKYPDEDTETLVDEHYWSRGGNASNTATMLSHLGADVEFCGTLVKNRWLDFLKEDFQFSGVNIDNCVYLDTENHKSPVAVLILSSTSGSRTALPDFRNVTELTFEQFDRLDLNNYQWIHFEVRAKNTDIAKMMDKVCKVNASSKSEDHKIKISVEIEQAHSICPELRPLFDKADVVFVSKDYAVDAGFKSKEEALNGLYERCKANATLICAWGDKGAAGRKGESLSTSAAFPPEEIIDTLGAGDTFNAAVIYALSKDKSVEESLVFGCRVAGAKCGMRGFNGVIGLQRLL